MLALAFSVLGSGVAAAAPLEAYGKLPAIEEVAISPDGARLALVHTDGEKRTIAIENLAQHKIERALAAGESKLRGVMWVGPDHLVVLHSLTTVPVLPGYSIPRQEYQMGFEYNLTDNTARPIMERTPSALNAVYSPEVRTVDGKETLFVNGVFFRQANGVLSIYRLDLDKQLATLVQEGEDTTEDYVLGPDGQAVAETTWNEVQRRWALKVKVNGFWHEVRTETTDFETPELMGLGRDGRSILVRELKDGTALFREVTPEGVWSQPLPIEDASSLIHDPVTHRLIGYSALDGDEIHTTFFDPKDQAVWDLIQRAYPDQLVRLASWSDDRKKIVVEVDSPTLGEGYAVIDLAGHHADWVGNTYDKLGPDDISLRKPIAFKAADGMALTGYLTIPHGKQAKNLPLVVLPHGGPQARDEPTFDWLAEGIASRGYAVLQVNYRGSDGFGWDFTQAGFGQWGRKMQTDLSDGVRYLAGQGIIDPKRVCIVGASYGGYAALAGATLDPGVYRCAVSYAGPANLQAMVGVSGAGAQRYWLRFMGAKKPGDPALAEISPTAHVQADKIPILLIHGKDDTVVPLEQSYMMANDLKAAGKPAELIVLDSTDHWLTKGETRLKMLQAAMAFVEKNNPPN